MLLKTIAGILTLACVVTITVALAPSSAHGQRTSASSAENSVGREALGLDPNLRRDAGSLWVLALSLACLALARTPAREAQPRKVEPWRRPPQ